jgi:hypothetical protein
MPGIEAIAGTERRTTRNRRDSGRPAEPREGLPGAAGRVDQGSAENPHEVLLPTARRDSSGAARPPRPDPHGARHARHRTPFYRAVTTLDALALIEPPPGHKRGGRFEFLLRWRRRELNPRPRSRKRWRLRVYPAL